MFDSLLRSLAAASVARGYVGAWLDCGCFRRGPGGLRRGLLLLNNCRPLSSSSSESFRAEARRWWTPAERRSMAPREASGERCTTPEKTLTLRTSRARACKRVQRHKFTQQPHCVTPAITIIAFISTFSAAAASAASDCTSTCPLQHRARLQQQQPCSGRSSSPCSM